ncbi:hypothetical protein A3I34_02080 [Candidatus Jorgensenbacteria bacterium RIFCSPLOWO2_02_FULL_45_12]|uniref:PEGA domain-containing protein n=2 Tax=Candidatus Joergenseniibacteriota TaxID=1752739 RepID=A0A1F6BNZ2_9BACT|nr:MAG: hypothetical protein UX22_C0004G0037 [Candidatus Jorgensenbacteria bacterium GW2011_GWA2_45_9]OGG38645.1 MAG: hypothetical protein A3D55_00070 [Candidatus Jorgensenbacteria bacterium RIFCSPHIGHO2_02_FULL_45_20]OGG42581.1 MAG: hypothetical protein A3I34_02080 [Candidatus Jorgensenbacteria bacterium RIFCSPLOWO2_02_FULL_45_12]
MLKRTRKTLFYSLCAIFVILGIFLITSAQGLIFNWKEIRFVKTGGIYLRYLPSDAQVFINGKRVEQSPGILNRGIFVKNLTPGSYEVLIQGTNYSDWTKDILVESGFVSAKSDVRLWPAEIPTMKFGTTTDAMFVIADRNKMISIENQAVFMGGKKIRGVQLMFSDFDSELIATKERGGTVFLTGARDMGSSINLSELFNSLKSRQLSTLGNVPILAVTAHPWNSDRIIVATERAIYGVDIKKIQIEQFAYGTSSIKFLLKNGSEIIGISEDGDVIGTDVMLKKQFSFKISSSSLNIQNAVLSPSGKEIFIKDDAENLFVYAIENAELLELGGDVVSFAASPDGAKVAWLDKSGNVRAFYIEKDNGDLKLPKGTFTSVNIPKTFIGGGTEIFWAYGISSHIFFKTDGSIFVSEIDPRGNSNTRMLVSDTDSSSVFGGKIHFSKKQNDGTFTVYEIDIR